MRIDPAIPHATPLAYAHTYNPYHVWYRTLTAGAVFAAFAFVIQAVWHFAWLTARVRGYPPRGVVRLMYPFAEVGTIALLWVGIWLVTTDDPSPQTSRRFRASLLRLIGSLSFVALSAQVLGFLGEIRLIAPFVSVTLHAADILIVVLLLLHLRWLAQRLGVSRGVQARMLFGMLFYCAIIGYFQLWPSISSDLLGVTYRPSHILGLPLGRNFSNIRLAMIVLASTICALVLARTAMSIYVLTRDDRRQ